MTYLKIVIYIKYIFSVNKVAMTSTFKRPDKFHNSELSIPQQSIRVTDISNKQTKKSSKVLKIMKLSVIKKQKTNAIELKDTNETNCALRFSLLS